MAESTPNHTPEQFRSNEDFPADARELIRFASHIPYKASRKDCWEWSGTTSERGYGIFTITRDKQTRLVYAHRLMEVIKDGPLDPGECVCHACDNPRCVNPDHLFRGSYADNNLDRAKKQRGPQRGRKILPDAEIEIARLYSEDHLSIHKIAQKLGLSASGVYGALQRRRVSMRPKHHDKAVC